MTISPDRSAIQAVHAAYRIQFTLRQDDLVTAEKWGNKLAENVDALPFDFNHIPSRLLIAQGKISEAAEELQVTYDRAVESEAQDIMIKSRVYQALAAETEESALEFLADAIGIRTVFCIAGAAILVVIMPGFFIHDLMNIEKHRQRRNL